MTFFSTLFSNFTEFELCVHSYLQVADKGVEALQESKTESNTESAEGVKTIELLFKLGAECLER